MQYALRPYARLSPVNAPEAFDLYLNLDTAVRVKSFTNVNLNDVTQKAIVNANSGAGDGAPKWDIEVTVPSRYQKGDGPLQFQVELSNMDEKEDIVAVEAVLRQVLTIRAQYLTVKESGSKKSTAASNHEFVREMDLARVKAKSRKLPVKASKTVTFGTPTMLAISFDDVNDAAIIPSFRGKDVSLTHVISVFFHSKRPPLRVYHQAHTTDGGWVRAPSAIEPHHQEGGVFSHRGCVPRGQGALGGVSESVYPEPQAKGGRAFREKEARQKKSLAGQGYSTQARTAKGGQGLAGGQGAVRFCAPKAVPTAPGKRR